MDQDPTVLQNSNPHDSEQGSLEGNLESTCLPVNEQNSSTIIDAQTIEFEANKTTTSANTGDVLNNRYRLEEQLGHGGMGSVFKALDLTKQAVHAKNHFVAIKVLLPTLAKDSVLVTGFHREAEKAQKLTHANIIKVFDSSRDGDRHYIVMEYLQGKSLSQTLKERGPIPLKSAWPIIRAMGRGLAHAHEENIIHSDFKPANVFVLENSQDVKILDFGIATELKKAGEIDETIFDPRLQGGLTSQYASFEMLNGATLADRRDDIFAFGLVSYELLTGKHPYNRKPASEVYLEQKRGIFKAPGKPPGLNKTQWQLLSQAIAIEQENRPENLQAWLTAFDPEQNSNTSLKKIMLSIAFLTVIMAASSFYWLQNQNGSGNLPSINLTQDSQVPDPDSKKPSKPPVANAGPDLHVIVGQDVTPDGKASQSFDAGPLRYAWQLLEKPEQSIASVTNASTAKPLLTPDKPGLYRLKLIVTDALNQSSPPVEVAIQADAPPAKLGLETLKSQYQINQHLQVRVQPTQNGYLSLVHVSSTGEKQQIFPNPLQKKNQVKANHIYQIPPKEKPKMLEIRGPEGIDSLIAVFSTKPLPEQLESFISEDGNLKGLQQDVIVEKTQYQVINN
jgi:serine/threonine protein kinase